MPTKLIPTILLSLLLSACTNNTPQESSENLNSVVYIDTASYATQARLPCENGSGEFCHLRTYQVMVESFVNGDPSIGYGDGYGTSHHMGDLQGIIDSLDHISNLGVNALWITPVFDSQGSQKIDATGYFAKDYFRIDPNVGDLDTAKALVKQAHEKGLYVFFDGVFGHHKGKVKASPSGLRPSNGKNQGNVGREAVYPDDLAFYQEVAAYWTETLCLDGWRLDQAYQVPLSAWVELQATVQASSQVNAQNPSCHVNQQQWGTLGYMVAEVWDSNRKIVSSAYGGVGDKPQALASAFDFPRRYALVQSLAVEESGHGYQGLSELLADWNSHRFLPKHAQPNLMLGNHDLLRFGDLLQRGGISTPSEADYWARHQAAFSYMAAYSGPITFYYGEEIGQEVDNFAPKVHNGCAWQGLCDDHVARSSGQVPGINGFEPSQQQQQLITYLQQLMQLRATTPALYQGSQQILYVSHNLLALLKQDGDQQVLYILNSSESPRQLKLKHSVFNGDTNGQLHNLLNAQRYPLVEQYFELSVPALSGQFYQIK